MRVERSNGSIGSADTSIMTLQLPNNRLVLWRGWGSTQRQRRDRTSYTKPPVATWSHREPQETTQSYSELHKATHIHGDTQSNVDEEAGWLAGVKLNGSSPVIRPLLFAHSGDC